jgi:DNA-binding transcriptional LysR family regulator
MNLRFLSMFAVVGELGSISKAAESLHVSQPAVSKGIRELEAEVGEPLLDRNRSGVVLTETGLRFFKHACELVAAQKRIEWDLTQLRGLNAGRIRLGASTSIATYMLPPVIARFHKAHPNIDLVLLSANKEKIINLVIDRELDFAWVGGSVVKSEVTKTFWRDDEIVLVMSPDHVLAGSATPIAPSAISGQLLIVREQRSGSRNLTLDALSARNVTPCRIMEIGSTETIKQIVASGVGMAFLSREAATDQVALGRLRIKAVKGLAISRPVTCLRLTASPPTHAMQAFISLLKTDKSCK